MIYRIGQVIRVHAFKSAAIMPAPPTFTEVAITETSDRVKRYTGKILRDVVRGVEFTRRVGDTMAVIAEGQLRSDWEGRIELVNKELYL